MPTEIIGAITGILALLGLVVIVILKTGWDYRNYKDPEDHEF